MRSGAALDQLGELAERVRPVTLTREQRLPVLPALEGLLPGGGLRRGATVSVGSSVGGATSLALALVAEASQQGSWVAAVGVPSLGLVAADELGVALERLVLVAAPERDAWGGVVAALVDGFDLVVLHAGRTGVRTADARRLVARARERGAVLRAARVGLAGEGRRAARGHPRPVGGARRRPRPPPGPQGPRRRRRPRRGGPAAPGRPVAPRPGRRGRAGRARSSCRWSRHAPVDDAPLAEVRPLRAVS